MASKSRSDQEIAALKDRVAQLESQVSALMRSSFDEMEKRIDGHYSRLGVEMTILSGLVDAAIMTPDKIEQRFSQVRSQMMGWLGHEFPASPPVKAYDDYLMLMLRAIYGPKEPSKGRPKLRIVPCGDGSSNDSVT